MYTCACVYVYMEYAISIYHCMSLENICKVLNVCLCLCVCIWDYIRICKLLTHDRKVLKMCHRLACVHMHAYMYICMFRAWSDVQCTCSKLPHDKYMLIYMYIYIYIYIYIYVFICLSMVLDKMRSASVCHYWHYLNNMYIHIYIYIHVCIYICIYIHIHIHKHIYIHNTHQSAMLVLMRSECSVLRKGTCMHTCICMHT